MGCDVILISKSPRQGFSSLHFISGISETPTNICWSRYKGRMTLIFVRPYLDTVNYYTRGYHFQSLQCKIFVTFTIPVWSILYSSLTSVISNDLVITLFTDLDLSFISCWTWREEHGGFYMLSFGDAHRQMEDM